MKKLLVGLLVLGSFSSFADMYQWECSTHNFLQGNVDNANAIDVVFELDNQGENQEYILSENSSVKITLTEFGESIQIKALDKITGKNLGSAIAGIDSRNLSLWPGEASSPGFYHVSCFNLDYNKTTVDESSREMSKEIETYSNSLGNLKTSEVIQE